MNKVIARARLALSGLLVLLTVSLSAAAPAQAHHGFTGEYDASAPLYVAGTVVSATYGYPHGLVRVRTHQAAPPPQDLLDLSDAEQRKFGGLDVVRNAEPVQAADEAELTLLLPPPMTTELAGLPDRPTTCADVGAVVFRECSTGELRVQLLRISNEHRVVRSGVMQTEVESCDGHDSPGPSGTAGKGSEAAASQPVEGERAGAPPFALVAVVAATLVGLAGTTLAYLGRRSRAGGPGGSGGTDQDQ